MCVFLLGGGGEDVRVPVQSFGAPDARRSIAMAFFFEDFKGLGMQCSFQHLELRSLEVRVPAGVEVLQPPNRSRKI